MVHALTFTLDILRGKTLGRALFNRLVEKRCRSLSGVVIDLAGGASPSYARLLPSSARVVRTDVKSVPGVDRVVDMNRPLPFEDKSADAVLLFNAIYIVEDPKRLLGEVLRILKPGGRFFLASPFLAAEMPEPHDYVRFTREGLVRLLGSSGFADIEITPFGERFAVAANLLHPFFLVSPVRLLVYPLVLLLDALTPRSLGKRHPAPLGYFAEAVRP